MSVLNRLIILLSILVISSVLLSCGDAGVISNSETRSKSGVTIHREATNIEEDELIKQNDDLTEIPVLHDSDEPIIEGQDLIINSPAKYDVNASGPAKYDPNQIINDKK